MRSLTYFLLFTTVSGQIIGDGGGGHVAQCGQSLQMLCLREEEATRIFVNMTRRGYISVSAVYSLSPSGH